MDHVSAEAMAEWLMLLLRIEWARIVYRVEREHPELVDLGGEA